MSKFKEENKLPEDDDDYGDEENDQMKDLDAANGVGVLN
jgi:hypothetical protein